MAFMQTASGDGGGFNTYVKYNAKAGRWYTKRDDSTDATEMEVADMTAVIDLENIQTGWFLFEAGVAPSRVIDPAPGVPTPKPGDRFKKGFQCLFYSPMNFPSEGLREFATTANAVIEAFNALHDDYMKAPQKGNGQLPVVRCTGVNPITSKHGTNYQPVLEIVDWADRPEVLANATMEGSTQAAPAAPTEPTAPAPVAAPAPAPAPEQAPVAADPAPAAPAAGGNLF
jgi:hypothetical protein